MRRLDVLIAGGGSAGLAAAIASARAGARTLLVERHGALGGMATAALVHSICGLYLLRNEPEAVPAHPGFPREFAEALLADGGATGPVRFGRVDLLLHQPVAFARLADRLTMAEPNLEVLFHTEIIDARGDGVRLREAELFCRGVRQRVEAAAFVDATGDALLSLMAGEECETAPVLQRPAYIFSIGGVAIRGAELDGDGRMRLARRIVAGIRSGTLPEGLLGAQFRPTPRHGEIFVTLDLNDPPGGPPFDPASPASLTALERYGRELAGELVRFLVAERKAFQSAFIAAYPTRVGIRESRRVVGRARIETEDLLGGATFPDAVALSTWPIEMRERATGPRFRFPEENRPCEIPLGALRARCHGNLFLAGRCLSASHGAQAALRVIGTALATGEAAGFAAALAARGTEPAASGIGALRESLMSSPS